MFLVKKISSTRTSSRLLCFIIICTIAINVLWYNISYQYISSRIVAMSKFKVTKSGYHVVATTPPTTLRSVQSTQQVRRFMVEKIVDNHSIWNDRSKEINTVHKSVIKKSNVSKSEQQKIRCKNNDTKCTELKEKELAEMNAKILEHIRIRDNETKDSFVNLHRYGYYLDSNLCVGNPDVIILVHSKFDHFKKRTEIRNSWASNRRIKGKTFTTVFLLGEPSIRETNHKESKRKRSMKQEMEWSERKGKKLEELRKRVYLEASMFGDIVMGNFTDTYRNLTIKHIMALKWAITHCPHVGYFAKVDDDVFVDVYRIAKYISGKSHNTSGLLTCKTPVGLLPLRSKRMKWFVSETEYPFPAFPVWCLGFGELMTRDVAETLLKMSQDVRSFWIDDVFVTGLLRLKAGLPVISMTTILGKRAHFFVIPNYYKNDTVVSLWKQIVAKERHQNA